MKFSNASKRSVQGFDKRSSRKKWSLAVALLALLVLAGCNKASTGGGAENGSEKGSENGATKQMSQEELVQLVTKKVADATEVDKIVWEDGLQIDRSQSVEIPEIREGEEVSVTYFLVTDKEYQSLDDLYKKGREVFSEKAYDYLFGYTLYSPIYATYKEQDGKLYALGEMYPPEIRLVWLPETAKIHYQSESQMKVFVNFFEEVDPDLILEGAMRFVKEDGQWKLDSDIISGNGSPFAYGAFDETMLDRDAVIKFAGNSLNGYRLDKKIEDYIVDIDQDFLTFYDEENEFVRDYFGVNIYAMENNELKLEDKLFVPIYGDLPMLIPEKDQKGVIQLDYTAAVENPGKDSIFGYVNFGSIDISYIYELPYEFNQAKMISRNYSNWDMGGDALYGIIPKYYGTTTKLILMDKTSGTPVEVGTTYQGEESQFVKSSSELDQSNVRVEVSYQGENIRFDPYYDYQDPEKVPEGADLIIYGRG